MCSEIKYFFVLSLISLAFNSLECYPSGAPETTCEDLFPKHKGTGAQTTASPFRLTVHKINNSFELHIESTGSVNFRGFIVQAHRVNGSKEPLGRFEIKDTEVKTLSCSHPDNTITHTNRNDKQSVSALWVPTHDMDSKTVFKFVGTIVQNFKTIYSGVTSEPITLESNSIEDNHMNHNKDVNHKHIAKSQANSSPISSMDYLLIVSTVLLIFRRN